MRTSRRLETDMTRVEVQGVAHLGIRVRDLDRARSFYEKVLGFTFIVGPVGPEPVAILKHPSGVEINLILNAASDGDNVLMDVAEKHAGYTHVALRVPDVDVVAATMEEHGIEITGGPMDYPGGNRGLFVRDPDRNVVEFFQYG